MQRAVVDLAVPRREQPKGHGNEKAEQDAATDDAVDRHRKQAPGGGDLGRARLATVQRDGGAILPARPFIARRGRAGSPRAG